MGSLKRGLAIAAVIAASATGIVLTGSPASAALPYCNNVSGVHTGWYARYETYVDGSGYTTNCDMNWLNENGNDGQRRAIRQIQWDLVMCYQQGISIDGEYGPATKQAVKNVQSALGGLTVDGWAGPNTRKKMKHVAAEETFCENVPNPPVIGSGGWEWLDVPYF